MFKGGAMRITAVILSCFSLFSASSALAQSSGDTCHVYVLDLKATARFREKTDFAEFVKKSKQEQEAIMSAAGVGKQFDAFTTKIAEEELTTKSYPFPGGKQVITASVFYTDESMASTGHPESVLMGIVVGAKAIESALDSNDAAIAEVSYDDNTDVVRVKRNIVINSCDYIVGLECRFKQAGDKEKK
jgi:hypothetical protein